ncbi:hypothetical protein [Kitasatospora aureofaciens]|uniref:hypothetical protein n=1 Tax=Kitasatospora aureofaciens TaxID=1894 RepID=UPI00052588C4|nr:hypothetical protein [Kitasatospora aureofaciens]
MTLERPPLNARLLRWALALYPASYGAAALAEVTLHAEHRVSATGRIAGLREVADVAGYGARVRLGLVSHRPAGRALATAAPLAAVLAGTYAAWHLWLFVRIVRGQGFGWFGPLGARGTALAALMLAPAVLMAVAVLAGHRTAARALALVTVVATPPLEAFVHPILDYYQAVLLAFNAFVLLVAPPDRTSHPSRAVPWAVALSITAAQVTGPLAEGYGREWALYTSFQFVAPVVTGVAVACTARAVGPAALTTAVLAGPPLFCPLLLDMGPKHLLLAALPVVLFTVGYAIGTTAVRLAARLVRRPGLLHR